MNEVGSSPRAAQEAFESRFTIVFIRDMEKLKEEHARAIKNEQVWRAEWEQISAVAKTQQERIVELEEKIKELTTEGSEQHGT